jgi:hypothetical protein
MFGNTVATLEDVPSLSKFCLCQGKHPLYADIIALAPSMHISRQHSHFKLFSPKYFTQVLKSLHLLAHMFEQLTNVFHLCPFFCNLYTI